MDKIKVIAKEGTKCPMENAPRDYITDDVAVDVDPTMYYLRLINDGSLRRVKPEDPVAPDVPAQKTDKRGGNK